MHLQKAQQLLGETALTLKQVAQQSGFGDPHWLATSFRRHLPPTPTQYRSLRRI